MLRLRYIHKLTVEGKDYLEQIPDSEAQKENIADISQQQLPEESKSETETNISRTEQSRGSTPQHFPLTEPLNITIGLVVIRPQQQGPKALSQNPKSQTKDPANHQILNPSRKILNPSDQMWKLALKRQPCLARRKFVKLKKFIEISILRKFYMFETFFYQ